MKKACQLGLQYVPEWIDEIPSIPLSTTVPNGVSATFQIFIDKRTVFRYEESGRQVKVFLPQVI